MVLHSRSRAQYDAFVADPPQAILLVSPAGTGKRYTLNQLALDIVGPYAAGRILLIEPLPDKKSIGIEQIRDLKSMIKLAQSGRRVVLVPDAHLLTDEAQNTMLKILEEPPKGVHFLLGIRSSSDVLVTIRSRCTSWYLVPPTKAQLQEHFAALPAAEVTKAIAIADGRIGLATALLTSETSHPLLQAVEQAKELLGQTQVQRLSRIDGFTKDKLKEQLPLLLDALELVCKAALEHAASKNSVQAASKWATRLRCVTEAQAQLRQHAQAKLVLLNLFLAL